MLVAPVLVGPGHRIRPPATVVTLEQLESTRVDDSTMAAEEVGPAMSKTADLSVAIAAAVWASAIARQPALAPADQRGPRRSLRRSDPPPPLDRPDRRDLLLTCGASLHRLRVALAEQGFETEIRRFGGPNDHAVEAGSGDRRDSYPAPARHTGRERKPTGPGPARVAREPARHHHPWAAGRDDSTVMQPLTAPAPDGLAHFSPTGGTHDQPTRLRLPRALANDHGCRDRPGVDRPGR